VIVHHRFQIMESDLRGQLAQGFLMMNLNLYHLLEKRRQNKNKKLQIVIKNNNNSKNNI